MKQLFLVRHGQSQANVDQVFAGQADSPLTDLGRQQAQQAGENAKNLGIDHIISSPLSRAHDTARIIAKAIGYPEEKIELNSLLMERSYGSVTGKPWDSDFNLDDIVDVETIDSVKERGRLAYLHLQTLPYDTVLVVAHGTFATALRNAIYPELPVEESDTAFKNAEVVQLI